MDEIKEATLEIRRKLGDIEKAIVDGFKLVSQSFIVGAEPLTDLENDYGFLKRKYDALWHLVISDYNADPSILMNEVTNRLKRENLALTGTENWRENETETQKAS